MRNLASGTPLRSVLRADDWNNQQRLLRSVPPMTEVWGASEFESPYPNYEYVVNNSGETFGFGDVIAIERCLNRFSAQRPDNRVSKGRLVFEAYRITDDDQENVGILLQELKPGELGKCVISGACLANVEVTDLGHRYAKIKDGKLKSVGDEGMFVLLDQVPEVGQHLIPVRFNCKGKQGVVMLGRAKDHFIYKLHRSEGTWSRAEFYILKGNELDPEPVEAYCHYLRPFNVHKDQWCVLYYDHNCNKTLFAPLADWFTATVVSGQNGTGNVPFTVNIGESTQFSAVTEHVPTQFATSIFSGDTVRIATKDVWGDDKDAIILNPFVDAPFGTIRAIDNRDKPKGWDWCDGEDGRPNLQDEHRMIVGGVRIRSGQWLNGSWDIQIAQHNAWLEHDIQRTYVQAGTGALVPNTINPHQLVLNHQPTTLTPPRVALAWIIRTH